MANPLKKSPPSTPPKENEAKRPHLRLVTKETRVHRSKPNHTLVVWTFLGIFTATLGTIVFLSSHNLVPPNSLQTTFMALRPGLSEPQGLLRFQTDKGILRSMVSRALNEKKAEAEENLAQNIAVYLFPELLSDEDFEKMVALDQWKPMQEAIEKSPKSPESRIWFEEMRANIWNYESPDRENPRISDYAKEVLRLYDELSSP